jgi:hypothetical protein
VKYLFILILMATLGVFFYWRLRPYIRMVRRFLGVLREVRSVSTIASMSPNAARRESVTAASESLVRCVECGTWLPASRAIQLRAANSSYCSRACLERTADTSRSSRKTAS